MSRSRIALVQGIYYALTGVWALVDIDSFQAVTGPKTDLWLVKTFGMLVAAFGAALVLLAMRRRVTGEAAWLAASVAVAIAISESYFAIRGQIWAIYLVDALIEAVLVAGWALTANRGFSQTSSQATTTALPLH